MNTSNYLNPLVANEATLLITCFECCCDVSNLCERLIYKHTSLASSLAVNANEHYESIKHYILKHKCKKIVVIINTACKATHHLLNNSHSSKYVKSIQLELKRMIRDNHLQFLKEELKYKMLAELNVISQCGALMQYDFIHKLIKSRLIALYGVVIDSSSGKHIEVVRNGYRFNDSVSMN